MALGEGIDTYIIKTVSICNLNCSYCYYYNGADTSYVGRPRFIGRGVIERLVPEIIAHSREHGVTTIDLTLHGGEPLLQPKEDYLWMMDRFDAIERAGIAVRRKFTTNAVTLDDRWAELLARFRMRVGVSIDGSKPVHDRFRLDLAGRGSYDRTIRGLKTALSWADRGLTVGTISVIDPTSSARSEYHHLRGLGVTQMNFILPEGNYAYPPRHLDLDDPSVTLYGDFLCELFEAWVEEDDPDVQIRFFEDIISGFAGAGAHTDQLGGAQVRVAVIETDGAIEPTDSYKVCADRMTDLGLDVFHHTMNDLYDHEFFRYCLDTSPPLPPECKECPYVGTCRPEGAW